MVDGIGEIVVEAVGEVVEAATGSRSRKVRWAGLIALVVMIAVLIWVLLA